MVAYTTMFVTGKGLQVSYKAKEVQEVVEAFLKESNIPRREKEVCQGLVEGVEVADPVHDLLRFVGGHLADRFIVKVPVPHNDELADPHVVGATGRRTDIPGKFRTLQDYGDIVEIHLHTVFTFVTSAQRVQRRTASQKAPEARHASSEE